MSLQQPRNIFGVLLILYYDCMCSETDFTQEKVNFHATSGILHFSSYCCCPLDDHLQEPAPRFDNQEKGMKNAFLRPLTTR